MPPPAQLNRFDSLRVDVDSVKGRAPHKPLLLLSVLDLLEDGRLTDGWVELCPDLVVRFQNYWPIVQERRDNRGDIRMPFHALGTDRVWQVYDADGRPSRARATSVRAKLAEALLASLGDSGFRDRLRRLLVATYFPPNEQVALYAALGFKREPDSPAAAAVAEDPAVYRLARDTGRSARFKNVVVTSYRFTCALTGYRLTTSDQIGVVDAAHIHQHSRSQNNDPDNGLALTPTAHRLFDLGLWSVTNDLRVIVKPESVFVEDSPAGGFNLRALHDRPLHVRQESRLRPNIRHLTWHRKEHGFE